MSKLKNVDTEFVRLILRSPDTGEGWRKVGTILSAFVTNKIAEAPDLFETKIGDDLFMVRLSAEGQILAKYI